MKKLLAAGAVLSLVLLAVPVRAGDLSPQLMMSSAWCTFSYNQTTGYSHTSRLVFYRNGTYARSSRGEGYSSGSGGSMTSQSDGQLAGQWRVLGGELYLSEGSGQLEAVRTVLKRNNNGYYVIVADGVEYTQCR